MDLIAHSAQCVEKMRSWALKGLKHNKFLRSNSREFTFSLLLFTVRRRRRGKKEIRYTNYV